MLTLPSKHPSLPTLGFLLGSTPQLCFSSLSADPISKASFRFIFVHLNIHDSLHFCSKRHLFI
uniref:Uncharacterized protein n=1 Tax=Amazona collaria TaxID=241587 RepID=A0A8B9J138_9PSIT